MKNFSEDQKGVLEAFHHSNQNLFVSGPAGCGKSYVINEIRESQTSKIFPTLASTGAASILIGGRTFHSFMGLGLFEGGKERVIERALKDKRVVARLNRIEGFILDEVSMIPGEVLETAEAICAYARKNTLEPWGGLRVIFVGDFAQLPPVQNQKTKRDWAFLNSVWRRTNLHSFFLSHNHRSENKEFLSILEKVRSGEITDEVKSFLKGAEGEFDTQFSGTTLLPTRREIYSFNKIRLEALESPAQNIPTLYEGETRAIAALKKNAPLPEVLTIKVGALVMMRRNDPKMRWVNGSLGEIIEIQSEKLYIRLKSSGREVEIEKESFTYYSPDGDPLALATNFPINLAYATTIHKSQGMTLEALQTKLSALWEPGQAYVALSRIRDVSSLRVVDWSERSFITDKSVTQFYQELQFEMSQKTDFL